MFTSCPCGTDDVGMRRSVLSLAAAGLLFGITVPLSKLALGWLDPAWLAAARFALAAPVLAVLGRRGLRGAVGPRILVSGALGYGGMLLLQNAGMARTSVSHAALLIGAVPAMVVVLAAVTGRRTAGVGAWVGCAVSLGGVALVTGSGAAAGGGGATLVGDALVVASTLCSAAFVVAQPRLLEGRNPVAVTAVQRAAAAAVAVAAALLLGAPVAVAPLTPGVLVAFVALVLAGSALPYALYAYGQSRVPAETAGAFVNLEPIVGVAAGVVGFGDPFGPAQALGAAVVLGGIALVLAPPGLVRGRVRGPAVLGGRGAVLGDPRLAGAED